MKYDIRNSNSEKIKDSEKSKFANIKKKIENNLENQGKMEKKKKKNSVKIVLKNGSMEIRWKCGNSKT